MITLLTFVKSAQIAKRALDSRCTFSPEEIVVTAGCIEAVTLALQATCRPGDTVAIASPVYYTFLHSIQWLGLKILEIPSTPQEGISIEVLNYAIRHNPIHACLVISNFNNPLGSVIPDERKRELVSLLAPRDIPLIEDDVYGDLTFGPSRPTAVKAYDEKGLVLYSRPRVPGRLDCSREVSAEGPTAQGLLQHRNRLADPAGNRRISDQWRV